MNWAKSIGGYFELELSTTKTLFHKGGFYFNSGRNSLRFILDCTEFKKIYIPYYTCDAVLEPITEYGLDFEFYYLDQNFYPILDGDLQNSDVLLYTNYFGVNSSNVERVIIDYRNCIIDNSQSFFDNPLEDIYTFYSPRKFFGVPDGGIAYTAKGEALYNSLNRGTSYARFSHLLKRIDLGAEAGYNDFRINDESVGDEPLMKMSALSKALLECVNYEVVRKKRNENFNYLHAVLKEVNELADFIEESMLQMQCPMVYPFLKTGNSGVRNKLQNQKVFTAQYWPNVPEWLGSGEIACNEMHWYDNLIALPIDQRYGLGEMKKILKCMQF